MVKICGCGKKFDVAPWLVVRTKYCSKSCFYKYRTRPRGLVYKIVAKNRGWFKKGSVPVSKGKILKTLGDYSKDKSSLHKWLRKHWGHPKECEQCGSTKSVEWANKTGKYIRKRNDWLNFCKKCHNRYDYEHFGARKTFYE